MKQSQRRPVSERGKGGNHKRKGGRGRFHPRGQEKQKKSRNLRKEDTKT